MVTPPPTATPPKPSRNLGKTLHALCKKQVGCFRHGGRQQRELAETQQELMTPEHKLIMEYPSKMWIKTSHGTDN